jgi:hypothetical protein
MSKVFNLFRLKFWYKGDEKADRQEVQPFAINMIRGTASFSVELSNPEQDGHPNLNEIRRVYHNIDFDELEIFIDGE